LVAAQDKAAVIRGRVKTFDATTDAKFMELDREISDLDHRAAKCDEGAEQLLDLKRKMRVRYAAARATEREQVVADLEREAGACYMGVASGAEILAKGRDYERERVFQFMRTCYESDSFANGATIQTHSVAAYDRWQKLVHEIPSASIAERMKAFANGERPLWRI